MENDMYTTVEKKPSQEELQEQVEQYEHASIPPFIRCNNPYAWLNPDPNNNNVKITSGI